MRVDNVVLPDKRSDQRFSVEISNNKIKSTSEITSRPLDPPTLLLPALCHPHVHLDKPYLLTSHPKPANRDDYPDYSDLKLQSGGFPEALSKTSEAKARYTVPDLLFRGSQLIAESIQAGVTSMRAFAEVDHVTKFKCLEAAIELKQKYRNLCYVQICAFAQDPIMSTERGEENRLLMEEALTKFKGHIEVLGATPYVEKGAGRNNIRWAVRKAIEYRLHLDFHLDFSVDAEMEAMIWPALDILKEERWTEKMTMEKRIIFGHCTRLSVFSNKEMGELADAITDLPVAFVGLPTSDIFMMGRPDEHAERASQRERGTLQAVSMIESHGLPVCLGVNNVGNAFTPWGSADPLRVASLGVGLYHAGTDKQARILYECVSSRARQAIGLGEDGDDEAEGSAEHVGYSCGGILSIKNEKNIELPGLDEPVPARQKLTITDVVWDPPEMRLRQILRDR